MSSSSRVETRLHNLKKTKVVRQFPFVKTPKKVDSSPRFAHTTQALGSLTSKTIASTPRTNSLTAMPNFQSL
jgi:hypothetical protein